MEVIILIGIILLVALLGVLLYVVRLVRETRTERGADDGSSLFLGQRLEALATQVGQQLEHSRQASERSTGSISTQVGDFTRSMEQLRSEMARVQDQVRQVVSFQDIFRNPKLRGNWGEYSLESALSQYFPRGTWRMQHSFSSGQVVDAILTLPNGLLLPIDSKFNWENFQKMAQAEDAADTDGHRKLFLTDVKGKIDEIASKYLVPGEGTTDFALMYVPAEAVYYEIINNVKEADIADYARRRKVVVTSPNTFYLTVSAVQHWFRDAQFTTQAQVVMKRLETVIRDAGKLEDDFRKLGTHLSDASSAYERSEKKLGHLVERTQKVIELSVQDTEETLPSSSDA